MADRCVLGGHRDSSANPGAAVEAPPHRRADQLRAAWPRTALITDRQLALGDPLRNGVEASRDIRNVKGRTCPTAIEGGTDHPRFDGAARQQRDDPARPDTSPVARQTDEPPATDAATGQASRDRRRRSTTPDAIATVPLVISHESHVDDLCGFALDMNWFSPERVSCKFCASAARSHWTANG